MQNNNREEKRIDHDRLFKELLQVFFEEFLILFFPKIHEKIDFAHAKFLDKEFVNDTSQRENKEIDVILETKFKGEDGLIIVHVEAQASYDSNFNKRMFVYFNRLFEKHQDKRIIPIALFSYDNKNKEEPNTFEMNFPFLDVLRFQYLTVELKKYNWRDFIRQDNPVAGALMSKMAYTEDEKIEVKKEFLRMLVRLELDPARNHLLTSFFDTYLKLTEEEEHILQEAVKNLDPEGEAKVMELINSYERKGMEKGIQNSIVKILKMKFGSDSNSFAEQVYFINDGVLLDEVLEKVLIAESVGDAQKIIKQATK